MILGTAGHIDHGKTALVRALTGVDTDRLPEEKRRGITIDLGFAPLRLADDLVLGVVDVPGHEAFVRTMLAGATGMDVALLVIAADEGPMPQTREHLAILELLQVPSLVGRRDRPHFRRGEHRPRSASRSSAPRNPKPKAHGPRRSLPPSSRSRLFREGHGDRRHRHRLVR
jgi:selenocysteine-specific translation elongation factor